MDYVLNGENVGNTVVIDDVTYPRNEFANLTELTPVASVPTVDNTKQIIDWHEGSVIGDEWVTFTVRDMTSDEKLDVIRTARAGLLAETDWTGLTDVVMSDEMATYRQALRDLPTTVNIDSPVYPIKP
jgi:hypothetical protein